MGRDWVDDEQDRVWAFPDNGLQGVDVVSAADAVFALACEPATDRCSVLHADRSAASLTELPAGALPAGFVPRGIVRDDLEPSQPTVCVYGNGLLCEEQGTWVEAIPIEADLQLNDVAIDWGSSPAVGSHGRYFTRTRAASGEFGPWVEQPPLADVELTSASNGVIIGDGRVQAVLGELDQGLGCGTPEDLVAFVTPGTAVTRSGGVLMHATYETDAFGNMTFFPAEPGQFCEHQQFMIGDILSASTEPCGLSANPRMHSERSIVGWNSCPIG